jgi:uncharacterized protein YndB with AHSA1/START domain
VTAHTVSVTIDRSPADVYAYAGDPANLPEWSFVGSITPDGDAWIAEVPGARTRMTFTPPNAYGVLDHDVELPDGTVVHVPMRVVAHGTGSEVLFTTFTRPGVDLDADLDAVRTDLARLKRTLES